MRSLCTTGLLLNDGKLVQAGDIGQCIESYFTQVGAFQTETDGGVLPQRESTGFGGVVIRGPGGHSTEQGEPFEAQTIFRISQEVSGFSLYCIVEDMQNRMVFHLREESPSFGLAAVSKGDYSIRVTVPPLWLSAGLYSLHFKVQLWGGPGNARHVSDKFPLDVSGSHSMVNAVLHPAATWRVEPQG